MLLFCGAMILAMSEASPSGLVLPRWPAGALYRLPMHVAAVKGAGDGRAYRFVASYGKEDRNGNVVEVGGWQLDDYRRNPVVLFGHSQDAPVGRADFVGIEGEALLADVVFASTSRAADVRQLIDEGVLRGMSAGWISLEAEVRRGPGGDFLGMHFKRQSLVELSVVSAPALPEAVLVAGACEDVGLLDVLTGLRAWRRERGCG